MTLRTRVIAIVVGLVVAGIAVASVVGYTVVDRQLSSEIDRFLRDRAAEVVDGERQRPASQNDRDDGRGGDRDGVESTELPFDPDAIAQTLDADGAVVGAAEIALPVEELDLEVARGGRSVIRTVSIDGVSYRMITAPDRTDGGAVQIARELTSNRSILGALRGRVVVVAAALAAVAALLSWVLMRRAMQPLEDLAGAAERVAATGDLTPLRIDRNDEVGRLAGSFDRMLGALSTSRQQQRRLVQDAGHELRTPLTSLRANIEFLERAPDLPADQRASLVEALRSEVEELGHLVGEVIDLASGDAGAAEPETDVDLGQVVTDAVERFRRRTGREVVLNVEPTVVTGSSSMLERAVGNLLGNAHKFSPPDTPIEVRLVDRWVSVRDHGPGVAEADLAHIFDRFYRSDEARARPGSGLGLAIVQQVASQHGGEVRAANADGGGADIAFSVGALHLVPGTR